MGSSESLSWVPSWEQEGRGGRKRRRKEEEELGSLHNAPKAQGR